MPSGCRADAEDELVGASSIERIPVENPWASVCSYSAAVSAGSAKGPPCARQIASASTAQAPSITPRPRPPPPARRRREGQHVVPAESQRAAPVSPSYLMAPSVSPRVTNFCIAVASNTTGTATITAPAAIWVHLIVTSPVYWVKKIGQVALLYPVITSA